MTRVSAFIALLVVTLTAITTGYSSPKSTQPLTRTPESSSSSTAQPIINRSTFLSTTSAACLTFLSSTPAFAKEVDPSLKGTKKDPAFEGCLSQCMYECTKPKGAEQKSRAECIPECKSKCATTKAQLMKGEPKKD
mmetsp:Transcript_1549/g.2345  ORF Transcript_1549/g.2345 Transcript_1549/m.2345 type:complete len:136 (+) Transcript_1549:19-426(+)|eukprot:CAMPEP_0196133402 /NCGR_PEP_ID=MMETSP0910-20130528/2644_1 /TAXON_ID=49265 /ORGANISM="Thalassiosira rotula, Strain GSO102" /LENGTH=135 /DNA_ID=CAMNT_0041393127 /DNA_START=22 /DNA_END=429 /DNA_ORIENTATION=+